MSFLSRIFQRIWPHHRYIGRDLEGNRFYERPSSSHGRATRTVQYNDADDVWNYIGGGKRLPVQWSAWLTHTRHQPPTLEELRTDIERQRRTLANAALIEARERDERSRLQAAIPASNLSNRESHISPLPGEEKPHVEAPQLTTTYAQAPHSAPRPQDNEHEKTLGKNPTQSDAPQPQSWTPRPRVRGGNG